MIYVLNTKYNILSFTHHNIAEILLKLMLNTNQSINPFNFSFICTYKPTFLYTLMSYF